MDYQQALRKLRNHASLGECPDNEADASFAFALSRFQTAGTPSNFVRLYADVLDCLEVVNREINGKTPSDSFDRRPIDPDLVVVMSALLHDGWESAVSNSLNEHPDSAVAPPFSLIFWAMSHAWTSILHGDIDSLHDEIHDTAVSIGFPIELLCST